MRRKFEISSKYRPSGDQPKAINELVEGVNAGYDRNDTGSRISYGLNWSSYGNILGRTQAFIAQSYYFNDEDSFSRSMGDKNNWSDYVGRIYANPSNFLDLNC